MPKHRLKGTTVAIVCPTHGFVSGGVCPQCEKIVKGEGAAVHTFKPMVYNDICETPILIESKRHLKRECAKHGVRACRLM